MALPITGLRAVGCHSCRQWALRAFITSIGGPSSATQSAPLHQRRAFSSAIRRPNEARERRQQDGHVPNDINDIGTAAPTQGPPAAQHEDEAEGEQSQQELPIPWYLRVREQPSTQQVEYPMAARQRIPDLPDHPPPLLATLLQHVSVELGMDDLSLLDLRNLDPPPALGSNLLMIVGTARSEKHLHVSADRLCRWLRSDPHFLSPFADGLLGRNELKLKMRRKAKRSKLMAGSGVGTKATADGEVDDGIRTGWVCVNVGRVEGGNLPEQEKGREERASSFVGFGAPDAGGCRIVVQMMTEEKRGEIDLEKLWTGIVNRSRKEKEKELEKDDVEEAPAEDRVRQVLDPVGLESSEGSVQKELGMAT